MRGTVAPPESLTSSNRRGSCRNLRDRVSLFALESAPTERSPGGRRPTTLKTICDIKLFQSHCGHAQ
jgi:hypothetical protein